MFKRMTVIGIGLIGGSIARAARENRIADHIVGSDGNELSLAYGRKHGFIDTAASDPKTSVAGSQLVVIATPPSTLSDIAAAIGPALAPGTIVMDVCSVKQAAIAAIAPHIPEHAHFIPAHPIAGSEQSGVAAARADLFAKKRVLITPPELLPGEEEGLQTVTAFWKMTGARVEGMPPHLHDLIYAYVSHLPQLLAFAAAGPLAPSLPAAEAGSVFGRFTRLCSSPVPIWGEIAVLNRENLLKALNRYLDVTTHMAQELRQAPGDEQSNDDEARARTVLFPRIAASCLITTVMEMEKQAGFPFARYAGSGFGDFTAPAARPPEEEIESISDNFNAVSVLLDAYRARIKTIVEALRGAQEPADMAEALG